MMQVDDDENEEEESDMNELYVKNDANEGNIAHFEVEDLQWE